MTWAIVFRWPWISNCRIYPAKSVFSILPDLACSSDVAARCRRRQREFLLHIPWAPVPPCSCTSPQVLPVHSTPALLHSELKRWSLDLAGYTAANNHQGSLASCDTCFLHSFAEAWRPFDRLFIDSRTSSNSRVSRVLRDAGCSVAENSLFLDHEDEDSVIQERLRDLERLLVSRKQVIAICHPRERTLRLLGEWLRELPAGVVLIPVSALSENSGKSRTGD